MPNENAKSTAPAEAEAKPTLGYHFIKSNLFRVIKVDGAWGGVGPRGDIHMSLFNERQPIPIKAEYEFTPPHTVGEEIRSNRISRDGLVREVEIDVVLTSAVARTLAAWLLEKADLLDKLDKESEEEK